MVLKMYSEIWTEVAEDLTEKPIVTGGMEKFAVKLPNAK